MSVHTAWIDEEEHLVTLPIWNLSNQMLGYIRHRPTGTKANAVNDPIVSKYYTIMKKQTPTFWGLESWNFSNTIFLLEGVFDAARITELGYSAIACMSNDMSLESRKWIWTVRKFRPVVVVCDSGKAGFKLSKYGHEFHVVEGFDDLGDASEEYVHELVSLYE